jgi:hypothetical protein
LSGPPAKQALTNRELLAESIEAPAALAEAVEVLFAGERKAGVDPRRAVSELLDGHPASCGLSQQPLARGIPET